MRKLLHDHLVPLVLLLATFGTFFLYLIPRLIYQIPQGLYVGYEHLWSDWPLHIAFITRFAFTPPSVWFLHNPMFADGKLSYPFLNDFLSGLFVRLGMSIPNSIIYPTLFELLALLFALYAFLVTVLKSQKKAILSVFLFFFSSGVGWIQFLLDFIHHPTVQSILFPSHFYTRLDVYSWYSGNILVGLLLPQRAFLLGMLMGVISLLCFLWVLHHPHSLLKTRRSMLVIAGCIAGLLMIAHIHSFIVVVVVSGLASLYERKQWKLIAWYVLPAAFVSILFYVRFVSGAIQVPNFIHIDFGWTAKSFGGWIVMWFLLWGLALPLAIVRVLTLKRKRLNETVLIGFVAVFLLANCILFQPVAWDNAKLFLWSYLGVSGLVASVLIDVWKKTAFAKLMVLIVVISLTATGALDIIRVVHIQQLSYQIESKSDIGVGEFVRAFTPPESTFLTASQTNASVMVIGGRSITLGFRPWVYNFGYQVDPTYDDMVKIYAGSSEAELLLKKHNISYVVVSAYERGEFQVNESFFANTYQRVFSQDGVDIYSVKANP